ncbi:MAG TPA: hypothetical protein VMV49_00900 [Candidatus Deferrimicrobium sp.]|nr:hypothetical protein [Candidatus Deferrimicrobium sp.]
MWEYKVDFNTNKVWTEPNVIIPYLKEWIQNQRWSGISAVSEYKLDTKNGFLLFSSDSNLIYGYLLRIYTEGNPNSESIYFIPIEIARHKSNNENFSIKLKCMDTELFIRGAELSSLFFETIFNIFLQNSKIQLFNSNKIQFQLFHPFFTKDMKIQQIKLLGGGNTTNTVVKLTLSNKSELVIKIFRMVSKNPEIKMLKSLYSNGFHQIPQPFGCIDLNIEKINYPLIFIYKYIEASGDGGLHFWNDLIDQLHSYVVDTKVRIEPLNLYCTRLGETIFNFHYHSSIINDDFFKPEPISSANIINWREKIKQLFQIVELNIRQEYTNDFQILNCLNSLKIYIADFLKDKSWNKLDGLMKIKIHQDLHLSQILTIQSLGKSQYIIIDFEGDPLLSPDAKFQKDPIFRDLAAICSAFHYIKFNALQQYLETNLQMDRQELTNNYIALLFASKNDKLKIDPQFIQRREFVTMWATYCIQSFNNAYIHQMKNKNIHFNLEPLNPTVFLEILHLFRKERLIKELYYESLFRKSQIIVPLIGLFELFGTIK